MAPVPASHTQRRWSRMHPSPYPTHPQPEPALHLPAGLWVASCPTCGF